jgi:SAM-dependent methyltransferase
MSLGSLFRYLPPQSQAKAYSLKYIALEYLERMKGNEPADLPPLRLRAQFASSIRPEEFRRAGQMFVDFFTDRCGLRPDDDVLEIGCGCGRSAIPLAKVLRGGTYIGLDIVQDGLAWCRRHISPSHPRFSFQHIDVYNRHYNPGGEHRASSYRFPFPDESFDFIYLTSVFTHVLPDELEHYLGEIRRLLRNGGRSCMSFFLWNNEVQCLQSEGRSQFQFLHDLGNYRTTDPHIPERAICYEEQAVIDLLSKNELYMPDPPAYGFWCGRKDSAFGQDMIVVRKK